MAGFEQQISVIRNTRSANGATTTAHKTMQVSFFIVLAAFSLFLPFRYSWQ